MTGDFREQYFEQVIANIEKFGVHITGVFGDEDGPTFAYTAGLTPHGHPELAMWGLPMQTAQSLLNTLAFTVVHDGASYGHGDTIHQLVRNFPVRLVLMDDSTQDLTTSNALFGADGPIPALQIVYPDKNGLWPWQDGSGLAGLPVYGPVPADDEGTEITLPD